MTSSSPRQSLLKRFARAQNGVAAVEFAIAVPIMLVLYLGVVEASTAIIIDRKTQTIASAIGDLISRAEGPLSNSDLTDYFTAASGIMLPYQAGGVVQRLAGIEVAVDGKSKVVWTKDYQDGDVITELRYKVGDEVALPTELLSIAANQTVILAEASYNYRPMFGMVFDQAIPLRRQSFHIPRTAKGVTFSN